MDTASVFTLADTHLFFSQSRSMGPNTWLRKSQLCKRGDDLAKQAAASNTKGVVGNSGRATPMPPSNRNRRPSAIQAYKSCYLSCCKASAGANGLTHVISQSLLFKLTNYPLAGRTY